MKREDQSDYRISMSEVFSDEIIKKFELGYSKEIWDGLFEEATKKGYKKELLEEAGLIITKETKTYDRFRSRVIFPIHNISGKPIAFGGRKLTSNDKQPKYINSPETELYIKSKVLYGLYQAKHSIRKEDNCILVEGYTDVISMHQSGIENVVSSSGTALTEDQVKLIRRYTENVTVLFDGDPAGVKASLRGIDLLLEGDLNVRAVALPEGEDPDSYSKNLGASGFRDYVAEEAQDIIRFKTKVLLDETGNDPVKKAGVIKDIISSITKINDPVKRTVYLKDCSDLLEIPESVLISEQNKILIEKRKEQRSDYVPGPKIPIPLEQEELTDGLDIEKIIELQEQENIRLLVSYGKRKIQTKELKDQYLINYLLNESEEIQFTNQTYRKIIEVFKDKLRDGEVIDGEDFLEHPDEDVRRAIIDLIANKYEVSEEWNEKHKIRIPHESEFLKDASYNHIVRLKFRILQKMVEETKVKLETENDEKKVDEFLDEIIDLESIRKDLAKILGTVLVG